MRDWLSHRAGIEPDAPALVLAGAETTYTFGTLDTVVDDLAGRLAAGGVDPEMHLGVVLEPRLEYVCLVHAVMRLGVTLVPMGDEMTARELGGQMDAADVDAVVCGAATELEVVDAIDKVADDPPELFTVDEEMTERSSPLGEIDPEEITPAEWSLDDRQLLLFTSGTTGAPKAVELTIGNLLASAFTSMLRLGFDPKDRWMVALPLHHMGGLAPILRMPLYGMTVIFREEFDAGTVADDVDRFKINAISLVPTMLRRMLDSRGTLSDSLRVVLLGGAPAPTSLIERCRDYSIPVFPTYGMTEAASQIATARPQEAYDSPDTVGRPLLLTDVTVVDDGGNPCPPGESGELVIDGPTVTPGYYDDEAANAEAFGEFGLHTGDVGVFDERGLLTVLNRVDDRILSGGENVEPGEVVDVLLQHPDIREAVVVGIPDSKWGERVSAVIVPDRDTDEEPLEPADTEVLLDFASEHLASYKLPKTVATVESLPRTVSGTVDRAAVRAMLSGKVDDGDADEDANGDVANGDADAEVVDEDAETDVDGEDDDAEVEAEDTDRAAEDEDADSDADGEDENDEGGGVDADDPEEFEEVVDTVEIEEVVDAEEANRESDAVDEDDDEDAEKEEI